MSQGIAAALSALQLLLFGNFDVLKPTPESEWQWVLGGASGFGAGEEASSGLAGTSSGFGAGEEAVSYARN